MTARANSVRCLFCVQPIVWSEPHGWLVSTDEHPFGVFNSEECFSRMTADGGPEAGHIDTWSASLHPKFNSALAAFNEARSRLIARLGESPLHLYPSVAEAVAQLVYGSKEEPLRSTTTTDAAITALREIIALHPNTDEWTEYGIPVFDEYDSSTARRRGCRRCNYYSFDTRIPCPTARLAYAALGETFKP